MGHDLTLVPFTLTHHSYQIHFSHSSFFCAFVHAILPEIMLNIMKYKYKINLYFLSLSLDT